MFVICDENDVVVDIASERQNLSRGYKFPMYSEYSDVNIKDVQIGDTYKDGVFIPDQQKRDEALQAQQNESKIKAKVREMAIAELKKLNEIPQDYK